MSGACRQLARREERYGTKQAWSRQNPVYSLTNETSTADYAIADKTKNN